MIGVDDFPEEYDDEEGFEEWIERLVQIQEGFGWCWTRDIHTPGTLRV